MLPLAAVGVTMLSGLGVYVATRLFSGVKPGPEGPPPLPMYPSAYAPPAAEPAPVAIEQAPPPAIPRPPQDVSAKLPTPPLVAPPPPQLKVPPLVQTKTPQAMPEPPLEAEPAPMPIEQAPPVAPPPPPVDTSAALPTPPLPTPAAETPLPPVMAAPPTTVLVTPGNTLPPAGFDQKRAASLAPALAAQIKAKQYNYDHAALKAFQTAAGITPDGVYGNDSWGALLFYTSTAPKALFKPTQPTPYKWASQAMGRNLMQELTQPTPGPTATPAPVAPMAAPASSTPSAAPGDQPPAGFNPAQAKKLAKQVAANIDSKGKLYSVAQLKQFQTAAGIASDGLYGGGSRRALIFYGVPRPPQPLFKPTATPPDYPWAKQAGAVS